MNKDILYPLRRLHGRIYEWEQRQKRKREQYETIVHPLKRQLRQHPSVAVLVLTPEHGNLGDHAIAWAIKRLLDQEGVPFLEITGNQLRILQKHGCLNILDGHPVFINGGGNLGTLWMDVEQLQREVIQKSPNSEICIFPNTIFYENSEWGKTEQKRSEQIYNAHPNLTIFAREKVSHAHMEQIYRDVHLVPDMVLSLNRCANETIRKGCLLCLRRDCEKTRTAEQEEILRNQAKIMFGDNVYDTDMIAGNHILPEQRDIMLNKKFSEFSGAELVITDRLHGMIFCAITGTPCIVVDSKSPKVRGCYEWISHLDYIRFADDVSDICAIYDQIPKGNHQYDNSNLLPYFEELKKVVRNYAHN